MRRMLLTFLLAIGLAALGFVTAAFLGAQFGVPPDAGLAGAAIVLFYGLGGVVVGIVVSVILGWQLPERSLAAGALAAVLAGGAVVGFFVVNGTSRQGEREKTPYQERSTTVVPEEAPASQPANPALPH